MRFMVIVKSTPEIEAGEIPAEEMTAMFEAMGKYNEELVNAGVMLAGEGLLPSSAGARIHFKGEERTVKDGPFTESKELIAGFWLWELKSMEEAIEWAKRCPNPSGAEGQLEIRQIADIADFGDAYTPEIQEQEARLRETLEQRQGS
ncbi:MAG: YciI family protein [Dehalococcoidia bacterium]